MSRSKDSPMRAGRWRPPGPALSGDFGPGMVRCSPRRACPVCGRDSFCSVLDGAVVYCTRTEAGSVMSGENDRGPWWMHVKDGATFHARRGDRAPRVTIARAAADVLGRANAAVISALRLDAADLDGPKGLRARGFDDGAARANGYRSTWSARPADVAKAVERAVGREDALQVPGVVWRWRKGESRDRGWIHWRAADGLLIPVRDLDGRAVAFKVRRRGEVSKGDRYLWVSSAPRASADAAASPYVDEPGPGAWAAAHVPLAAAALRGRCDRLLVSEGPLKVDIATALSGRPVVGVPGVSSWALALELVRAWGDGAGGRVPRVDVAFDMDADRKPEVARARHDLLAALRREGFDAGVLRWDSRFNGIDDWLAARRRGEV